MTEVVKEVLEWIEIYDRKIPLTISELIPLLSEHQISLIEPTSMRIEHLGIAVKDLKAATKTYEKLLNTSAYKTESVESEKVETVFFKTGESKIELLGATDADSVIAKYVEKKGEGLHHVAFEVDDIHAELERLRKEGFTVLNDEPKKGADNKLVAFVHPKDNHGVLVELCQEIKS